MPPEIVQTIGALLEFSYLVHRNDFDEHLDMVDQALARFQELREVFRSTGVHPTGFSLPHQHSLNHYHLNIGNFGAPNSLCLSITESQHITAVKKPWHRSSKYEALEQMLITNQCLEEWKALHADFIKHGMLPCECVLAVQDKEEDGESGPIDSEWVMAHVTLAQTRHKCFIHSY